MLGAQRRPRCEPRRHTKSSRGLHSFTSGSLNEGRGVNPGDTRAERNFATRSGSLNEGRGVNPGDTRREQVKLDRSGASLNEGRGVNPGDTSVILGGGVDPHPERSTKAEV